MTPLIPTMAASRSRRARIGIGILSACFAWTLGMPVSYAQSEASPGGEPPLDPQLHERVLMLPGDSAHPVKLQVTLMLPDGAGPFPLAVLNHGKEVGDPHLAPRYRSVYVARYFLSRGYAVAMPMMRGFAGSGDTFDAQGCDAQASGLSQAHDIRAVIDALRELPEIDGKRIVVSGQSMGGWNTLALGSLNVPGVRGLMNFAGGRGLARCQHLQDDLAQGAARYASQTQIPSIWFYGDNDKVFPPNIWHAMFDQYHAKGGDVELVAYGTFGKDAHSFLAYPEATAIWMPRVDTFLKRIGMPYAVIEPQVLPAAYPLPTRFAAVDDVTAVPFLDDNGRKGYRVFLTKEMPRVCVISPDGTVVESDGGYDPLARALGLCQKNGRACRPYAIDDAVVWVKPMDVPAATNFAALDAATAIPYLNDAGFQGYRKFLTLPKPRAFVIAPDGTWAYSVRGFDPIAAALRSCGAKHHGCRLYAADDAVVWAQ